jgi:hypothetical protein
MELLKKALKGIHYLLIADTGTEYVIEYGKKQATLRDQQDVLRFVMEVLAAKDIPANIYRDYTQIRITK